MLNAKRITQIALVLAGMLLSSFAVDRPQKFELKTVVIDAGHGGHDSGCLGSSSKEKNVALAIALKLGLLIEKNYPNVRVVFTRTNDEFVELRERAEIANRNHADLFICIHCNSNKNSAAFGVETFAMGLHVTDENLAIAKRENSVILLEKDYKQKYEGFDPNSTEAYIAFSLYQQAFLKQSLKFASNVQNQSEEFSGRFNRGVKQAGFLVLYHTTMPAVLIETGFLTNKAEERFLLSEKGQETMANGIFRAFREYKIDVEEGDHSGKNVTASTDQNISGSNNDTPKINSGEIKIESPKEEPHVKDSAAASSGDQKKSNPATNSQANTSVKLPPPVQNDSISKKEKRVEAAGNENTEQAFFTIQIGAKKDPTEKDFDKYKKAGSSNIIGEDGMTRFTVGKFKKLGEAMAAQQQLRKKGFKDAFVTAYINGKRVSIKEADSFLKKAASGN